MALPYLRLGLEVVLSDKRQHGGHNTTALEGIELSDWTKARINTLAARKRLISEVRDIYAAATGNASVKQADGIYKSLKLMFDQADAFAERTHQAEVVRLGKALNEPAVEDEDPFEGFVSATDSTGDVH